MQIERRWGTGLLPIAALNSAQNRGLKHGSALIGTSALTTSHGIRGGVASDNTDLPNGILKGPSLAVGWTLNHSEAFISKGKTFKHYVHAIGVDHFEARLNHPSKSLKHHFSPMPNVTLEPYRKRKLSPTEITQWIDNHLEFVEANENVTPEWLRQKASDIIHQENMAAHDERQRRGPETNYSTTQSAPRVFQDQAVTTSDTDQELTRNLASIQQVLNLEETELLLDEAQDTAVSTSPFSTAYEFIQSYAARTDRILDHRESRAYSQTPLNRKMLFLCLADSLSCIPSLDKKLAVTVIGTRLDVELTRRNANITHIGLPRMPKLGLQPQDVLRPENSRPRTQHPESSCQWNSPSDGSRLYTIWKV
jgi:hypothetical protein